MVHYTIKLNEFNTKKKIEVEIPVDEINAGFGVAQNDEWPNVMPK